MAVAGFAVSAGGGFGAAVAVARWGVEELGRCETRVSAIWAEGDAGAEPP